MRANMRCTLVAWLSPGSTSVGQLKGNRPVSSTYSVTPHDLQLVEARRQLKGCMPPSAREATILHGEVAVCQKLPSQSFTLQGMLYR